MTLNTGFQVMRETYVYVIPFDTRYGINVEHINFFGIKKATKQAAYLFLSTPGGT